MIYIYIININIEPHYRQHDILHDFYCFLFVYTDFLIKSDFKFKKYENIHILTITYVLKISLMIATSELFAKYSN